MNMLLIIQLFVLTSLILFMFLRSRDRGQVEPVWALWTAFGFGLLALFVSYILEFTLLPVELIGIQHFDGSLPALFQVSLIIGVIEEVVKFLPFALFIYRRSFFNEHTDGIIYFVLVGLGFGLPENILYTINNGPEAGAARLLLTPIFHSATTAFAGYYLARSKVEKRSLVGPIIALTAMILVHAFYDFGLLSGIAWLAMSSVITTTAVSAALFGFATAAKEEDEELGLSAVDGDKICPDCGRLVPKPDENCRKCARLIQRGRQ